MNKAKVLRDLSLNIERELALHKQYQDVLERERDAIIHFRREKVEEFTTRRQELTTKLEDLHQQRLQIRELFSEPGDQLLTKLVLEQIGGPDGLRLVAQIEKLKHLAKATHTLAAEVNQLLQFSLRTVGGTLSIIWSATQSVSRGYGADALVHQAYHPMNSRHEGVLRTV